MLHLGDGVVAIYKTQKAYAILVIRQRGEALVQI